MIRLQNQSASPFKGWKRVTVSKWPAHDAGTVAGHDFVLGRMVGIAARTCDVRLSLQPGQAVTLDLLSSTPRPYSIHEHVPSQATADPVGYFGIPHVLGTPLDFISMKEDGACFLIHLRGRPHAAPMLVSDIFVHWYPDQSWAPAVLSVTASNPAVPDLVTVLPQTLTLEIAGALVRDHRGSLFNGPSPWFIATGDHLGDGQTRSYPIVIRWQRGSEDAASATAFVEQKIVGRGLTRIGPLGTLPEMGRFDVQRWKQEHTSRALAALYSWDSLPIGVTKNSGDTGDQEDQGFSQGFEPFYAGGLGAEVATYACALSQMKRPCHHRERNGALLDLTTHPRLVMWAGRPHWHTGVSPDRLGKVGELKVSQTHGWFGPDREHWLANRVAAAYELTACPVLQQELEAQARNFLYGETVDRSLSTSGPDAARAAGWTGLIVAHLWRLLDDRSLAQKVRDRWVARVEQVYWPAWSNKTLWDQRSTTGDPRLAQMVDETVWPKAAMIYQSAVGAYGMYVAGLTLQHSQSMVLGSRCAMDVARFGYTRDANGFWLAWDVIALDAAGAPAPTPYLEGVSAHRTGWFQDAWTPLALWVLVHSGEATQPIREAWEQTLDRARKATDVGRTTIGKVPDWTPPIEPATT